jgi:small subunit ribosomal protein S21
VDAALKQLKKLMLKEGTFQEMKRRAHYEKPSVKRKHKAAAARKKRRRAPGTLARLGQGLMFRRAVWCADSSQAISLKRTLFQHELLQLFECGVHLVVNDVDARHQRIRLSNKRRPHAFLISAGGLCPKRSAGDTHRRCAARPASHPKRAPVELNAIELCDGPVRHLRGLDFNEAEAARDEVAITAAGVSEFAANGTAHAPVMPIPFMMSALMTGLSAWSRRRAASGSGCARPSARLLADPTNCLSLTTHVGQQPGIGRPLQSLLDQRPKDDLQTYGQVHGRRGPPGEHAGAVDELAR